MTNPTRLRTLAKQLSQLIIFITATAVIVSCSSDDSAPAPQGVAEPTYHGHIAAILYDNCVSCHQDGGIAPFSLVIEQDGLAEAKKRAGSIQLDVEERTMPPWLADNSGQCNTFEHARWLSDADIATIANWVDNGKIEGTAPSEPLKIPLLPGLTNESSIAAMSEPYAPLGNSDHPNDDYRCFLVDPNITGTTDQLLTAFEMQPGNDALVHHIILFGLPNQQTEDAAIALDAAEPGLGYTCFGGSGVSAGSAANVEEPPFLAGWAPGTKLTEYPEGTGVKLAAGRKMLMQVHYNLANLDQTADKTDLTQVQLKYTPIGGGTTQEAFVIPWADGDLNIPPGRSDHLETVTTTLQQASPTVIPSQLKLRIWGAFPHMHTYGKSIDASFTNATNGDTCLFDVPRWDFEWQQFFFYQKSSPAVIVRPDDSLTLNCHYDTTSRSDTDPPITWGEGTQDEMCLSFFYVTYGL